MGRAALREGAKPIQDHVECECVVGDRRDECKRGCGPLIVDLSEEVHGQMEGFGSRPADGRDALPEPILQPLRRAERGLGDGNGEETPHPAGVAVGVALRLGLAVAGVGLGVEHGLPPAFVSVTST